MITFILGVSATVVVGILVWSTIEIKNSNKRIKLIEKEKEQLWLEIQHRCDSIERMLDEIQRELSRRIDENYSYTDSRFDKFTNTIERDYVSKVDKASNTISYNN
jgi:exonuclease VII large subunit